jgi:hypothetical protein
MYVGSSARGDDDSIGEQLLNGIVYVGDEYGHHFEPAFDYVADRFGPSLQALANYEIPSTIHAGPFEPIVQYFSRDHVPAPPLVGIETNPGPPKKTNQMLKKLAAEVKQATQPKTQGKKKQQQRQRHNKQSVSNPPFVAAAYSTGNSVGKPIIVHNNDDSVTITHRELIAQVSGTVNFTSSTISIQPGLSSVLPWLSTQCLGWEKYRFIYLRAQYLTRTGSQTPGTMMLVPDYDAADAAPTTQTAASTFHGATDDVPWKNQDVNFDMKRSRELFIRAGPLSANQDIKTYDFGNLYICTADGTAVNWGKVYLEYKIMLINSQASVPTNVGGSITGGGTMLPATPLGTVPTIANGSFISSISGTTVNLSNLTIGQEYYMVTFVVGTGLTAVNTATFVGLTLRSNVANDLGTAAAMADINTVVASAGTGSFTFTATGTTVTAASVTFCALSNSSSF